MSMSTLIINDGNMQRLCLYFKTSTWGIHGGTVVVAVCHNQIRLQLSQGFRCQDS